MNRFSGTNVLVTGAASGIGAATVRRLVSEGAAVFAVDRDEEGLSETAASALGSGRVETAVVDVTDEAAVARVVNDAVTRLGGIEVLINIAGIQRTTPIETLTVADMRELFEVNMIGTMVFCREALRHLPEQVGVIVNIASTAADHGNPYMSAYAASKGAVLAFSKTLAAELVVRGIRVVPVSPGTTVTPLTANVVPGDLDFSYFNRVRSLLGPADPDQIAAAIAFAASRDGSYLTGAELRVDGGSHT
ncbi:NAD(P)-dependent dehydrogenase (short-subunit alcohol dehydrogenase family) [Nocardioides daedukensis]|uniref:NAD(P)-dependent dehydrogenase (Short-subunit alcohol dehydrogenase family) n=1 Tax=Nocardioides daedukensis TaxID=634462 RepID=A0A7Y9UR39_9ACTN|nr:SDR family oxidoreductase [Nocardioides daedukensis]NYG59922.1 NAD(P)-dependent dehydrogenase (short-subunit alcohol dehydrogenase family) [Nocardioides daedukensis]